MSCAAMAVAVMATIWLVCPALAAEGYAEAAPDSAQSAEEKSSITETDLPGGGSEADFVAKNASQSTAQPPQTSPQNTQDIFQEKGPVIDEEALAAFLHGSPDEEPYELILRLTKGNETITQVLIGLQRGVQPYIPMKRLADLIRYKADIDFENKTISGFFGQKDNSYNLNLQADTYSVRGKSSPVPEHSVILRDLGRGIGDFYVSPALLNEIWPLDLEMDFSELTLSINTKAKLPFERARERERRQALLEGADEQEQALFALPYIKNQYKTLSLPVLNTSAVFSRNFDGNIVSTFRFSGRNDLLGTSADYSGTFKQDRDKGSRPDNFRLRLTRRDYDSETLPYDFKLFQAGDITLKPAALIDPAIRGAGVRLSTRPNQRFQNFDTVTIEGTAIPGWEVELYRGQELIDFGEVDESGQYVFDDVQLEFGGNIMRTVLYGPQGQVEERVERFNIGMNMPPPGKTEIEVGLIDENRELIPVNADEDLIRGRAAIFRADHGISHWLSAFGTLTDLSNETGRQTYLSAGANISMLGGRGQIEAYKQRGAGHALDIAFARRFGRVNTNFKSSFYSNFESEEADFGRAAKEFEGEIRANTFVRLPVLERLGLSFNLNHTRRVDQTERTRFIASQTTGVGPLRLSNNINNQYRDGELLSSIGRLRLATNLTKNIKLRSILGYDIEPEFDLIDSNTEIRYRSPDNDFTAALNINNRFQASSTEIGLSASYDFGPFLGGVETSWDSERGSRILLRASSSFAPYGPGNSYIASSEALSSRSRLKARIFEDRNSDGDYDPGTDKPVPKANLLINDRITREQTNAEGLIRLPNTRPLGMVAVNADQESFENPFLVPKNDGGYRTVIRPTTEPFIDIPVIATGEIDGSVYFADGEPIPGIIVQLINQNRDILQETPTGFDGFYIFEFVRPGDYTVRISPSHEINVPPKHVSVTSEDLFAFGVDLQEQAKEVPAAEEAGADGRVAQTYLAPAADGTLMPAPTSSDGGVQPVVRTVRIGEHPHKVRLVLDLSAPSAYSLSSLDEGEHITIDLPGTAWDAKRNYDLSENPLFKDFEVYGLSDESGKITGTQLHLNAHAPVEIFYNAALPAEGSRPDRIYIDFIRK